MLLPQNTFVDRLESTIYSENILAEEVRQHVNANNEFVGHSDSIGLNVTVQSIVETYQ